MSLSIDKVRQLRHQNEELAGRLGWMSHELEEARGKIVLLEAPKPEMVAPPKVWWKFWA